MSGTATADHIGTTPAHPVAGVTLRRLPCPATEPPFDDEIGIRPTPRPTVPVTQGALALAFTLPSGVPAVPEPPPSLRIVGAGSAVATSNGSGTNVDELDPALARFVERQPTSADRLPEARRWSARLAQAIVETLHGHRPVQQLLRWTDDTVYSSIAQRLSSRPRPQLGARPMIRTVRVCSPTDGVAEASVVVEVGRRFRALALRLEGLDGQWRCTALEII